MNYSERKKKNITLIGMSGVGKSTIGKMLSRELLWDFVDIDRVIEKEEGKESQHMLNFSSVENTVFAPGGSIIYSPRAMEFLKENSIIIYLKREKGLLLRTVDPERRGIVGLKEKTFAELFDSRQSLYVKNADVVLDLKGKRSDQVIDLIKSSLEE